MNETGAREFTAADFLGSDEKAKAKNREKYCKCGCKSRKKHKCAKYKCRIVNAPCDPVAELMKQKGH